MRWLWFLTALPLLAQSTGSDANVTTAERWLTGSIDFGYRATSTGGSGNTYRTVVGLGDGPRLFGLDFMVTDPARRLFDRLTFRANDWGGDPYNTAHLDAVKRGLYSLHADYRDVAYFNFLPSFADPLLGTGIVLDENAYATRRRMADVELDLRPGSRIVPYFVYGRDSGRGNGITTFVSDLNEYPIATRLADHTDSYRGGVRWEWNALHAALEQGGTTLGQDERAYTNVSGAGNNPQTYFEQTLSLSSLAQSYAIGGDSIYSKGQFNATPARWTDIYGQFLYSRPETNVQYRESSTGNFVLLSELLFYTGEQAMAYSQAKEPHTTANAGIELRPTKRVRVVQTWTTDRLHVAGGGLLTDTVPSPSDLPALLFVNYSQEQTEGFVDLNRFLAVRGGYRYVWGDAQAPGALIGAAGQESGSLEQRIGLAGVTFRAGSRLSGSIDFEDGSSGHAYFRTSLYDYRKLRARAKYQAGPNLTVQAIFALLDNQNPTAGINYDFLSRQNSLSATWTPSKRVSVVSEYTRSTLRSNAAYLEPELLAPELSLYRDNAHAASALVDVALPPIGGLTPRISAGGSVFISWGSRPTSYEQPLARVAIPLTRNLSWNSEYRYYGFSETFYGYEGFRAHVAQTGLRLSR